MLDIIRKAVPQFDEMEKTILVTHADVDHCGLLPIFDKVIVSAKTAKPLKNEYIGKNGYGEEKPLHKPYINICRILTTYEAVNREKFTSPWNDTENLTEPLTQIGFF